MRHLLLLITLFGCTVQAQKIQWLSFDDAIEEQKKEPKPIFIDVYTDWCGPCKLLDKETFSDAKIIEHINENYYAVKFNTEGEERINFNGKIFTNPRRKGKNSVHTFATFLQIPGYPSMIIIDKDRNITKKIVGFRSPDQLITEL